MSVEGRQAWEGGGLAAPGLAALRRSPTYESATVTAMCACMVNTLVPSVFEVSGTIVPDLEVMVV